MESSESIKELTTALAKAQLAFQPIKRTEPVDYPTKVGRKKYYYAPLPEVIDATKKALSDNGLAVIQLTKLVDGDVILETILSHISGERVVGEMWIGKQDQPDQDQGSSLTYKRRYSLSAILGVSSEEDDDAQAAQDETDAKPKTASATPAKAESEHFCKAHGVAFYRYEGKDGSVWYSHKLPDGTWCKEAKMKAKKSEPDEELFPEEVSEPEGEKMPETKAEVKPITGKSSIDVGWFVESIKTLQGKGQKSWGDAKVLERLNDLTGSPNKTIEEALCKLTQEQAVKIVGTIKERLSLA